MWCDLSLQRAAQSHSNVLNQKELYVSYKLTQINARMAEHAATLSGPCFRLLELPLEALNAVVNTLKAQERASLRGACRRTRAAVNARTSKVGVHGCRSMAHCEDQVAYCCMLVQVPHHTSRRPATKISKAIQD